MTSEPTRDATRSTPAASAAASHGDAPTEALFHMSRTAGVGLGDYAAVNVRAVVGLLLGVASVLAYIFADSQLPLLIPIAAIVVSIVAFIQIQASNGTQTGRGIALGGVALALILGGSTVAKQHRVAATERDAQAQLNELVHTFSIASASGDGRTAYELFSSSFQAQVRPDVFQRTLVSRANTVFPNRKIERFELGPRVNFDAGADGSIAAANTLVVAYASATPPAPPGASTQVSIPIDFVLEGGRWRIQDIQNYFIQQDRGPGR